MRALYCAAVLAAFVVPGYSETIPSLTPLTIVYRFDAAPSETAFREMTDQIETLTEAVALHTEWRKRSEITGSYTFGKIVLVDFHGSCGGGKIGSMQRDQRLGWAQVVDGKVLPFVEIECGRIQATLDSNPWGSQAGNVDIAFGRALARVLGHELYHVLAGTTSHSRSGIAKPELSGHDLASSDRLAFTATEMDQITSPQEPRPEVRMAHAGAHFIQ